MRAFYGGLGIMQKQKIRLVSSLLIALVFGSSCNGQSGNTTSTSGDTTQTTVTTDSGEGVTVTEIDTSATTSTQNPLANYTQSAFSKYLYFSGDGKKVLIDFNFFPQGADFDSQKKQVTIPCEYQITDDENVSASVNAPVDEEPCEISIVVDLSQATFLFYGVEFSFDTSLDAFDKQFEFKITAQGFVDSLDNAVITLSADDGTLENIYNAVMDKRI